MRWNLAVLLFAAGFTSACGDDAIAPGAETFTAIMNGANERPAPLNTPATGLGTFTLSSDRNTLTWTVTMTGANNVTASHIHLGGPNAFAGQIVFPIYDAPKSNNPSMSGSVTRAAFSTPIGISFDTFIALLESGDTYLNVHTNDGVAPTNTGPGDFPSGEMRGQITRR